MKKNRKIYWLFLAPSLLGVAVFYCVPFFYAAYYAVIDNIGSGQFVGLQNFIRRAAKRAFPHGRRKIR